MQKKWYLNFLYFITLQTLCILYKLREYEKIYNIAWLVNIKSFVKIIFGSIYFGIEQQLTNDGWFQINENCTGNVFSCTGFTEERVEWIITTTDGFIGRHLTIRLNSMFKTVKFPASVSNLDTSLTNMDRNTFPL